MDKEYSVFLADFKNALFQDKVYAGIAALRSRNEHRFLDLRLSELRIFSQNGEDGVLYDLVQTILPRPQLVSIGAGDGWSSNSRLWWEIFGWDALLFESDSISFGELEARVGLKPHVQAVNIRVTPENVESLLLEANVASDFGILDIDVDGQDYWVWKALPEKWRPAIVVCEYNSGFGETDWVVEEEGQALEDLTSTWGCSILALEELANEKGYSLIYRELAGVNAFFVRSDLLSGSPVVPSRSPNYGLKGKPHDRETLFRTGNNANRPTHSR